MESGVCARGRVPERVCVGAHLGVRARGLWTIEIGILGGPGGGIFCVTRSVVTHTIFLRL